MPINKTRAEVIAQTSDSFTYRVTLGGTRTVIALQRRGKAYPELLTADARRSLSDSTYWRLLRRVCKAINRLPAQQTNFAPVAP